MDDTEGRPAQKKGKLRSTTGKIINKKLEIAASILNRKLDTMDGFKRRREQSKEDIRQAARELFSHFGIEKVSIRDIAHKAGVSQATIYNNFGSKDALVREFILNMVDQMMNRAREIIIIEKPYREKLQALSRFVVDITSNDKHSGPQSGVLPTNMDLRNDPDIKKLRESFQEQFTALLLELVRDGKKQGQVNPELSEDAIRIYIKFFMEIFTDPHLHYRFHQDAKLVQDLISLMINGIGGQPL
jgi:AcrR family transcriptional regulator